MDKILSNQTITLDIQGMKCAGCVKAVERQLTQNEGVITASVNLITEVAVVEYIKNLITPQQLAEKLTKTGFPTQPRLITTSSFNQKLNLFKRREKEEKSQIQRLIIAILLLILSGLGHLEHLGLSPLPILSNIWCHWALATLALAIPGFPIFKEGWQGLMQKMPNMNTLVGLGTASAYLASCFALFFPQWGWECFFDEPVMLLGFILLGRILEGKARSKASQSLEKLLSLQPPVACLVGKEDTDKGIEIPVEQIRVGEWLKVLPGDKIPVDGIIRKGESSLDQGMLTGESVPIFKKEGDRVSCGTINLSGALIIETTETEEHTTLAQMIKLVEEAQTRKAPIQKLADTVAGNFAYGVMIIALLTFSFWYLIGTKIWPEVLITSHSHSQEIMMTTSPFLLSLKLGIAVLVVACPCALGLATPTAILVGTSLGAQKGILIKGGDILEKVQKLDTVIFDKTGTLTQGQPTVTEIIPLGGLSPQEILQYAATAESGTNHPLAMALLHALDKENLPLLKGEQFHTGAGLGIKATIEGKKVILGNEEWLRQEGIKGLNREVIPAPQTFVYLAVNDTVEALILFADQIRPEAPQTVAKLKEMGIEVMMMSGDRHSVATAIAQETGIKEFWAPVTPLAKVTKIKDLQEKGKKTGKIIAMVGDGINDAPALAQADLGIALKTGTEIALETAQIILMQNSLLGVVEAIELSRATSQKIKQNLVWAFGYNIIAIPLAAGLFLPQWGIIFSPVIAAALMALSSVIVVTNSLLLRRVKS